jgi:hypothetical protein
MVEWGENWVVVLMRRFGSGALLAPSATKGNDEHYL